MTITESLTEPPPRPEPRKEPTRRRLSLNLTVGDYADLEQLAEWMHHTTIHAALSRAVAIARRIHSAANPALRWPDLEPKDLPRKGYLALHVEQADGTETVSRLELL